MNENHAGSATGIDRLIEIAEELDVGNVYDLADGIRALARATPQHPDAPAAAVRAAERIDAMHKGVVGVFAAIKAEHDAATPQHSVTEQSLRNGYTGSTVVSDFAGPKITLRYDMTAQADAAHAALCKVLDAQPLASTAATQPEQVSDAIRRIVAAFVKQGYATKYQQPGREAESTKEFDKAVTDLRAALAMPAPTAALADEMAAEMKRLHDALCFWLPQSHGGLPDAMQERIAADAYLLVGYDNMPDKQSAEELGWIVASTAASEQHASVSELPPLPCKIGTVYNGNYWTQSETVNPPGERLADVYTGEQMRDYVRAALSGLATIPSEADELPEPFDYVDMADGSRAPVYSADHMRAALTHRATTAIPGYKLVPMILTDSMHIGMSGPLLQDRSSKEANQAKWTRTLAAAPDTATTAADQQGNTASSPEFPDNSGAAQAQAGDTRADHDPIDELIDVIDVRAQPGQHGAEEADSEGGHHD